jgi:phenylalanyl-tRNA synthetase beta subunit
LVTRPSKKEFADWINTLTGSNIMTEKKLDQILIDAKKTVKKRGMNGLFEYMRQLLGLPISDEFMQSILTRLGSPDGASQLFQELQLNVPDEIQKASRKTAVPKHKKK